MASLIKNQLLKHLSRYTKNLSSDKINLSTFRGEGELSNLQLDEDVLTDLLELPSWLRLTSAWCNHVSFRISWTKLKSVPITLTLDEVNITVETCEIARTETPSTPGGTGTGVGGGGLPSLAAPQGKYSFIHKVIDGITIIVNTVNVKFKSPAFTASVQMSRIRVESKTPKWVTGDLRLTRLKEPQKGLILIFKELSWQTVRIEASSTQDESLTPLRLLTNHARCRITIKKKLSDCSLLASRLVLILDDLLWVLTDSQLKAALHFVDSLSGLIKASTHATQKTKAQKKLETLPEYQAQIAQQQIRPHQNVGHASSTQKMFNAFDVHETSYHFFSQRIDLHLCDDPGEGRSCHPDLNDGGALQVSVQAFQIDYYPYHLAKSGRSHWAKYKEASVPPALWLEQSLSVFREAVLNLSQPNRVTGHAPLERSVPGTPVQQTGFPNSQQSQGSSGHTTPTASGITNQAENKSILDKLAKLMSACVILRIEDFTLYRVTTSGKKQMPKEFVAGDKDRYSFPPEMPIVHAEFTYFYYPGDFIFPLPPSKIFAYANPIQINFDLLSVLWLNSFALNLHESLLRTSVVTDSLSNASSSNAEPSLMYMDVKLEAIMPRVVLEAPADAPTQRDRPKIMQVQISRFALTNIREMGSSRADLAQALHSLQEGSLVFGSDFPAAEGDMPIVTDRILSHVAASDVNLTQQQDDSENDYGGVASVGQNLSRYAMWAEPRDVWCLKLDPIWIDFIGARSVGSNKSIPFVDAVPVTIWVHGKSESDTDAHKTLPYTLDFANSNSIHSSYSSSQETSVKNNPFHLHSPQPQSGHADKESVADLHAIVHVSNLVSVQIDHYQYLFLLRLAEEMTELTTFVTLDANRILQKQSADSSIIFGCVIPQVEVTMIMPSPTPGKESNGGDAESVLPDSASLGDDLHMNIEQIKNINNPFGGVETPSPVTTELPFVEGIAQYQSNPNTHGYDYNVQIQSTPTFGSSISSSQATRAETQSISSRSGGGRNRNSVTDTSFSKELNSGLLSMKKGLTSFMTSIDSALKTGGPNDDNSDTFSIYSDVSSDSENFAMVMVMDDKATDCMDVMFRLNPFTTDTNMKVSPVEVASEVIEEPTYIKTNMSSPSEPSEASSWRRRDLVSMATFRLTTVELIKQNKGYTSSVRLQVSAVSCDECGAIPWDELQTKFDARCRAWNVAAYNPEAPPCIQLRLDEELKPPSNISQIKDKKVIQDWFSHKVDVRVKDITLDLSMSTVIGLGDLAEDEIITKPMPLDILIENLKINLMEDRPPVNITSPGPVPINLNIGKMNIKRDETGIFHIQPEVIPPSSKNSVKPQPSQKERDRERELRSLQLVMQQLKLDNDNLRKQLYSAKETIESNRKKARHETDVLKNYLKTAQDDIAEFLEEKRTLLDTVKSLTQQLPSADLKKKNDGNR